MIQYSWKEEKEISNFVAEHFFQFSIFLEKKKGETKLKLHLASDAIKFDLSSLFYQGLNEVVSKALEANLKIYNFHEETWG